ncbi:hypothetical protein SNEBB_004238 [Seison nebaliae]|nr:hypothetical protein SNEBB_004238 [Seison nebaliae]
MNLWRIFVELRILFSIWSYVIGVGLFLIISQPYFASHNYVSENALTPGLVDTQISEYNSLNDFAHKLSICSSSDFDELIDCQFELIKNFMKKNFIEFYEQIYDRKVNVYGFLRAPRFASSESIVIVIPMRREKKEINIYGISIGLFLMKHLNRAVFLAKDFIFLFSSSEMNGTDFWLKSYLGIHSNETFNKLSSRCGSIEGGIVLNFFHKEIVGRKSFKIPFDHLKLNYIGANGQLPNLDLINSFHIINSYNNDIPIRIHHSLFYDFVERRDRVKIGYYPSFFLNYLSQITKQATGLPDGCHSSFIRNRINAITIEGIPSKRKWLSVKSILDGIIGLLRSVNNLQERFHQSFFFYILVHPFFFIPIGHYMIIIAFFFIPLILQLLFVWFSGNELILNQFDLFHLLQFPSTILNFFKNSNEEKEKRENIPSSTLINFYRLFSPIFTATILTLFLNNQIILHSFKSILQPILSTIFIDEKIFENNSLYFLILMVLNVIIIQPILSMYQYSYVELKGKYQSSNGNEMDGLNEWKYLRFFTIFTLSLFIGNLAILNYGMAVFLLILSPLFIQCVWPFDNWIKRIISRFFYFFSHPISYLLFLHLIQILLKSSPLISFHSSFLQFLYEIINTPDIHTTIYIFQIYQFIWILGYSLTF